MPRALITGITGQDGAYLSQLLLGKGYEVFGLLHDLGKARIPLSVLNKPGKLTDDEFDVVRSHSEQGHAMLREAGGVSDAVLDACLHHHEKMDGTGYPHRLQGEEISVVAGLDG